VTDPVSVRDIVEAIDQSSRGMVFAVDRDGTLVAVATDGDVRRALLAGNGLDSPAEQAFNYDFVALPDDGSSTDALTQKSRGVDAYPVLDPDGRLVCVDVPSGATIKTPRHNTVVIMVGGKGLRLRPLTNETPKPMLFVGEKPMLQHLIEKLRDQGLTNIILAVNYLGDQIEDYFHDGSRFGVSIRYLRESAPMGTAGALGLLKGEEVVSPIVVMNGDLIVSADLTKMLDFHTSNSAEITVGAKVVDTTVPFGVLSTRGSTITGIEEKPTYRDLVNAGVYVLSKDVVSSVPSDKASDMPDLITERIEEGRVVAFAMHETWADLGAPEDLRRAPDLLDKG